MMPIDCSYLERNSDTSEEAIITTGQEGWLPLEQINANLSAENGLDVLFKLRQSGQRNPALSHSNVILQSSGQNLGT